jgi:hypothetical protein
MLVDFCLKSKHMIRRSMKLKLKVAVSSYGFNTNLPQLVLKV